DGEDAVIGAADVLVASTDDEFRQLTWLYGAAQDRLKTIHPGVDHDAFHPGPRTEARAEIGLGDEAVLVYAGRIQPLKGIDLAIRAVEQLVPTLHREVVLLVVGGASGSGGDRELARLGRLARDLGIERNVRFAGPHPHGRLPTFYRAADLVVVCSHSESFGLAALEAHACGIPVVGTAVGGLSHILRDGESGYLVDSRDPAVFAARAKTLLADDELRARFGVAAARRSRRFSWTSTAGSFLALYECLASERLPEVCTC
ncbi:MAG: glycosyltransferase, partial [Actinomycetota bacterium]